MYKLEFFDILNIWILVMNLFFVFFDFKGIINIYVLLDYYEILGENVIVFLSCLNVVNI